MDELDPQLDLHWSRHLPDEVERAIACAVWKHSFDLPVNLFIEWHSPCFLEKRFFVEASKYIFIPYREYWQV